MLHPSTELRIISNIVGMGVVATAVIPCGTVVWVLDPLDRLLSPEFAASLPLPLRAAVRNHGYFDREGQIVLCWDLARYTNHSCEPNCLSPGYGFELAIRDIHPGEQLTDDYLTLNLECDFECHCGAETCRGSVHDAQVSELVARWDADLARAFRHLNHVEQPLLCLLSQHDLEQAQRVVSGVEPHRSARFHLSPSPFRLPA